MIRLGTIDDIETIRKLQCKAFKGHPYHEPGVEPIEHLIVDGLRSIGVMVSSWVTWCSSLYLLNDRQGWA